jgi:hypothetical protein
LRRRIAPAIIPGTPREAAMAADHELANTYREHAIFLRDLAAKEKDAAARNRLARISQELDRRCLACMATATPASRP